MDLGVGLNMDKCVMLWNNKTSDKCVSMYINEDNPILEYLLISEIAMLFLISDDVFLKFQVVT